MALLKEDGSLDIERINKLPIEEYMKVIGELTEEQRKEYYSKTPLCESQGPVKPIIVDYTLEEDIERNGSVILKEKIKDMKKRLCKHNDKI